MKDFKQRFSFEDLDLRGCVVQLSQVCDTIHASHHYPPNLQLLINEFASASVLLRDSIKIEADVTVQLRSSGCLSLLMADCMHDGRVRAVAQYDMQTFSSSERLQLNQLSHDAMLAITITPTKGERYQSIVPLKRASLSACLQDYFAYSEQLPSDFIIYSQSRQVFAMSIHSLPMQYAKSKEQAMHDYEHIQTLMQTLSEKEACQLSAQDILMRLFHQEHCILYPTQEIKFGCVCSEEKSLSTLKSLGKQELIALINEQKANAKQGVEVDCHFCHQQYQFDFMQLNQVIKQM